MNNKMETKTSEKAYELGFAYEKSTVVVLNAQSEHCMKCFHS